jgi:prepilin peptidase CpaA
MHTLPAAIRLGLGLLVVVAAGYDLRFRRIPNWLNLSGIVLGFGLNALLFQLSGTAQAGQGMLLAFAIYLPFYFLRGMGAGDVKLMAAVGALVGPRNWLEIFIATALLGGATAALFALVKGRLRDTLCNVHFLVKDLACLRAPYRTNPQLDFRSPASLNLPHGVLIAIGSFVFLACTVTGVHFLSQTVSETFSRVF